MIKSKASRYLLLINLIAVLLLIKQVRAGGLEELTPSIALFTAIPLLLTAIILLYLRHYHLNLNSVEIFFNETEKYDCMVHILNLLPRFNKKKFEERLIDSMEMYYLSRMCDTTEMMKSAFTQKMINKVERMKEIPVRAVEISGVEYVSIEQGNRFNKIVCTVRCSTRNKEWMNKVYLISDLNMRDRHTDLFNCPSCNKQGYLTYDGVCEFCGADVRSAKYSWLIYKIEEDVVEDTNKKSIKKGWLEW